MKSLTLIIQHNHEPKFVWPKNGEKILNDINVKPLGLTFVV